MGEVQGLVRTSSSWLSVYLEFTTYIVHHWSEECNECNVTLGFNIITPFPSLKLET